MKLGAVIVVALALAIPAASTGPDDALTSLVEAERAFAATARAKGVRVAFLEFFEEDAVALVPRPAPARSRLLSWPARPFSAYELAWEPRAGDVARSGDFGWLTGPSRSIDHESPDPTPRHGSYLSVWRRQPDGRWRVHLDIGISTPEAVEFAPGMTPLRLEARFAGPVDTAEALDALLAADRELNADSAQRGLAPAMGQRLYHAARLHRNGRQPIAGREAIVAALRAEEPGAVLTSGSGGISPSADLGYTYGIHRSPAAEKEAPVVRLWARDADGRWWLMLDLEAAPV